MASNASRLPATDDEPGSKRRARALEAPAATSRRGERRPTLDDAENLRAFVARIAEGIYITSPEGEIVDGNPALLRIFGATSLHELQRYTAADLLVDPEQRRLQSKLLERHGYLRDFELEIRRLDGVPRTCLDTVFSQIDARGKLVAYHGILVDITERKDLERRYRELSVRDPLTGCHNRRHLERLRGRLERPTSTWGCVLLDIDDFKGLNDAYGHDEGDRVLQGLVHFLRRHGRVEDVLVRLGGDEFALIVYVDSRQQLESIAQRLLELAPDEAPATFSLGTAYRHPGEPFDRVLARADQLMYEAKGRGLRNGTKGGPAPRAWLREIAGGQSA